MSVILKIPLCSDSINSHFELLINKYNCLVTYTYYFYRFVQFFVNFGKKFNYIIEKLDTYLMNTKDRDGQFPT